MLSEKIFSFARGLSSALLCLGLTAAPCAAWQDPPAENTDEVIRISTDLVQTDVMVFDKQGNFVEGLKAEDFELKVEGKPQSILFFERVSAGSVDEDAQLAAARGGRGRPAGGGATVPLDRGRTIFFFLDDLHIAPANVQRTRRALRSFIENEVGQNDEAAIVSASGQIGFLQQLTTERAVLYAALERFKPRQASGRDLNTPPMNEVQALAIDHNDQQVLEYFVSALLRELPVQRQMAVDIVKARASNLLQRAESVSAMTLASLLDLVRRAAPLPGRKNVFFISDGFIMNARDGGERDRLRLIADAAARAGVVIYSFQASGLATGLLDISEPTGFDPFGQLASVNAGEIGAMQESLHAVAAGTGGRALLNTNALDRAVGRALKETSRYYLLAWKPGEEGGGRRGKFQRLQVSLKGRPDLNVVVRTGFLSEPEAAQETKREKKGKAEEIKFVSQNNPDTALAGALGALYPRAALPTSLSLGYTSAPDLTTVLTASVEIEGEMLEYTSQSGGAKRAIADVAGAVFRDDGKLVTNVRQELVITSPDGPAASTKPHAIYSFQFRLGPGLYQVRFAARDRQSGLLGSDMQWIEIPDLRKSGFTLSSLFLGERLKAEQASAVVTGGQQDTLTGDLILIAPDRRFQRTASMRFTTYIYNAKWSEAVPADVALQVQVFRDDQPIITTPLSKVKTEGLKDHTRIPYAAEIPLAQLPAGRYALQVTAIDRAAKASASRRVSFTVE
jgi:VWFA-related protein